MPKPPGAALDLRLARHGRKSMLILCGDVGAVQMAVMLEKVVSVRDFAAADVLVPDPALWERLL